MDSEKIARIVRRVKISSLLEEEVKDFFMKDIQEASDSKIKKILDKYYRSPKPKEGGLLHLIINCVLEEAKKRKIEVKHS